jgi:glycerol-3-phosphate dehydrogenase
MWTRGYRDEIWSRLTGPGRSREKWDLIVIGGGITGAGILGEAARHGKKALLVEGQDFASGTSSRSTKLVHGGLRYLRQGQFLVTRKSVKERETLMSEGKGLVDPLGFSLAAFPGDQMPKWMYGVGLAMYDALAWKWAHEGQSKDEIIKRIPPLAGSKVQGGYRYFDAQTDDARLVIRVLREAVRHGGTAINYVRADKLLRTADGKVRGVVLRDCAPDGSSRTVEVEAKVVISATGAWADELRGELGHPKRLRKIRGSHLTFRADRLPLPEAVSLLHPRDQRAVFAIPWEGVTILGTTDVDHGELTEEPAISQAETEYLLEAAKKAFPAYELSEKDVISTFSGVRPVIDTGKSDPSKESREHAIWKEDGLLTISGGKLTTFVVMARDALAAAEEEIGELGPRTRIFDAGPEEVKWPSSLDEAARARLMGRFGVEVGEVASGELARPIDGSIALWSELRLAARDEAVVTLADLLLRRVRLGLLLPNAGLDQVAKIRAIAQPELGWDDAKWEREEKAYRATWKKAYASPT